jgi:hypothetical protein
VSAAFTEGMETHPRADEGPLEPWKLVLEKWRLLEALLSVSVVNSSRSHKR